MIEKKTKSSIMMEEGSKKFLFDKEIVLKQPCLSVCLLPLNFNKIVCLFRSPGGYTRAHLQVRIGPCRMCELPLDVAVKCSTYFSPRRGCARVLRFFKKLLGTKKMKFVVNNFMGNDCLGSPPLIFVSSMIFGWKRGSKLSLGSETLVMSI